MKKVVIIGGGIAGLSAALSLKEHSVLKNIPFDITLIEKSQRLGGNIITQKTDGFLVEGGPDCFLSEKPWAMELCKRLGLGASLLPTNDEKRHTFVYTNGRLLEIPEGFILMVPTRIIPFLLSPLISLAGKIRMGLELFIPRKKDDSEETLGSFVRRRLGHEALDKIAEPLIAGVHAGDPETMSVNASFPKFVEMEKEHGSLIRAMLKRMKKTKTMHKATSDGTHRITMFMTLEHGLGELIDAIVKNLDGVDIRTGQTVSTIIKKGEVFEISLEGKEIINCDSLIIATPAHIGAVLLNDIDKGLCQKLAAIPYVSTATVSLAYWKKDMPHPPNGFGFVIPRTEGRNIMAGTWSSVKFKGRAPEDSLLIRCFVGGAKNEGLVSLPDDAIEKMVKAELKDIMGIEAEPRFVKIFRWKKSMPQYTLGHEQRVAAIEERLELHPGLYLTGSAYRGIGISDCIRLGEIAAKRILRQSEG
ncbi:MAG: protoporphyrinogen oxidase [Deltaproteobacteria bacterium]|nr:protoporphyrinogen oxidase [Deltaproteobacteria bacterium]